MRRLISMLLIAGGAFVASAQPSPEPALPSVAERAEFYRRIASTSSTETLAQLARAAATSADAAQRERLTVILDRYYELDRAGAVRLASRVGRDNGAAYLAHTYYERLARDDVNSALSVLSQVDDATEARQAAAAVFRALGSDERARELVAASLHGEALQNFRSDTLFAIAPRSPRVALDEALALPDRERRMQAAMSIVAEWAQSTPRAALDAVEGVADPELAGLLRQQVLRLWRDSRTLLEYLSAQSTEARLAALRDGALTALLQRDPRAAAELAAELPDETERRTWLFQIANGYAQQDPDGALAWARTLNNPEVAGMVVRGLAVKDPVRGFDAAASLEEPARSQAYAAAVNGSVRDEAQFAALLRRIGALPEGRTRSELLASLVNSWGSRPGNAARALDLALASGVSLPPEAFQRLGYALAQADPAAAGAYVERVPRDARAAWITAVTAAYAQTDVASALGFLERFRGEPAFDPAAIALTQRLAMSDPPAAARLLASVGTRGTEGPTPEITIARAWAARDPAAAMAWVLDLPPLTRNMVVALTASSLAQQDTAALESWALRLPAGEKRDVALAAVVRARGAQPPSAPLLDAFSDARARDSALMAIVLATAQADPAAARRLIAAHIGDPRMRAQAEQVVDAIARGDPAFPTGVAPGGPMPPFVGAVPSGFAPPGLGGPVTPLGPDGQPLPIRSPLTGSFVVTAPLPVESPASQRSTAPPTTNDAPARE
jgi:hypothetical protein